MCEVLGVRVRRAVLTAEQSLECSLSRSATDGERPRRYNAHKDSLCTTYQSFHAQSAQVNGSMSGFERSWPAGLSVNLAWS